MRRIFRSSIIAGALAYGVASGNNSDRDAATRPVTLRLAWIASGSYVGEVAAQEFAPAHGIQLSVLQGGLGLNPITLVQTGQSTCGTAAAEEVLAAIDKGASLVIVGMINQHAPVGFLSRPASGIHSPKDFEGHKVGLLPFGSTALVYQALLKKNSVNRAKVDEVNVSPDLRPFIEGRYDVQPVFVYDETVTLDQKGVAYTMIDPSKFGVTDFIGQVYFCRGDTIRSDSASVQAIIASLAEGWRFSLAHPDSALKLLHKFAPEVDTSRERNVIEKSRPYFTGYLGRPLDSDPTLWEPMIRELLDLKIISKPLATETYLNLKFVKQYYEQQNK